MERKVDNVYSAMIGRSLVSDYKAKRFYRVPNAAEVEPTTCLAPILATTAAAYAFQRRTCPALAGRARNAGCGALGCNRSHTLPRQARRTVASGEQYSAAAQVVCRAM